MYFSGYGTNGGWDMDDAKRSYEQFYLSRGKTPGGGADDGASGGGYTIGRIAGQMFFLVLACSLLTFISSGTPLLITLGVSLGLSAAFALATYVILRLIAWVFHKRRSEGDI
mgnify:CR=1 FL=1